MDTYTCPGSAITTISCDFEDGTNCGWVNNGLGVDWETTNSSSDLIPHAATGDFYLIAMSNQRPFPEAIARISSRKVTSAMPSNTQFSFWYHMQGPGTGYLRVILKEEASDQVLWERKGHQGNDWRKANITVCARRGSMLVFESAFDAADHVIAIDAVDLAGESDLSKAVPGLCPVVSCNFENDICGWQNEQVSASQLNK